MLTSLLALKGAFLRDGGYLLMLLFFAKTSQKFNKKESSKFKQDI